MTDTSNFNEVPTLNSNVNSIHNSNLENVSSSEFSKLNLLADDDVESFLLSALQTLRSTGFDGVTNLEINQVQAMQTAVKNYIDGIKKALEPLNEPDATKAFSNTVAPKIQKFIVAVNSSCQKIITNMEKFNEDLSSVKSAMEAKATSINTPVPEQFNTITSQQSN